jgi:hypothetical protein
MNEIIIVYYIYINPNKNWKHIVNGQLNDLKTIGLINSNLNVVICSEEHNILEDCIKIIHKYRSDILIKTTCKNLYEYPGIKLLYDLAQNNPNKIMFYMHSKGMVFSNQTNFRSFAEMSILRNTMKDPQKIFSIFENNKKVNKIGLIPHEDHYIVSNFYWVRSNYLIGAEIPKITTDRLYYEQYIGLIGSDDSYSLLTDEITTFNFEKVQKYKKENPPDNSIHKYFNLKNYNFYKDGIDITESFTNNCGNVLHVPKEIIVKFFNEYLYKEVNIDLIFDQIITAC